MVSPDGGYYDSNGNYHQTGHVMFVEKVEGGYAYITEGNYNGQNYHEDWIQLSTGRRNWGSGAAFSITGYIHLTSAPTATLSIDRKFYNPWDTVTFRFGGENTNGTYTLGIYKELDRFKTVDVNSDSYSIQFNEVASYSAYMTSYGISGGYADSNWVDWQVLPLTAELSADKTKCNVNDKVTLSFKGNNSNTFANNSVTLAVWCNDEYVVHQDVTDHNFVVTCNKPGEYKAYMTAYGGGTYKDSNWVKWTVYEEIVNIGNVTVIGILNKTYTGTAQTQNLTVKLGDKTLTNGTDYVLSYSNNINAGTATVTITGKGNYSGTVNKIFTINKTTPKLAFASASVTKTTLDAAFTNAPPATTQAAK